MLYKKLIRQKFICIYALLLCTAPAFAQVRSMSDFRGFNAHLTKADVTFIFPTGFKEIKPAATRNYRYDYGIASEDNNCEIWFKVRSQKENLADYLRRGGKAINPDSLYQEIGRAQVKIFKSDDMQLFVPRSIPSSTLTRYNADLGKTFLIGLSDKPETKHYKFAMVVVLQKNGVGTITAVCFANELGPGFFKTLNQASSCLKFN